MRNPENLFELSPDFCLFNKVCVIEQNENFICFGIVDEKNEGLVDKIKRAVKLFFNDEKLECIFKAIDEKELQTRVARFYGQNIENEANGFEEKNTDEETNVCIMLLDSLIEEAVKRNVTDIHIEENKVRFRENGFLLDACALSPGKSKILIRRVKVLSKINVMESRCAQDGQFVWSSGERKVFIRVSCLPVLSSGEENDSENIVLRLLDPFRIPLRLPCLGFNEKQCSIIERISALKSGLVLICGPTGSGKSTTAASILKYIEETNHNKKIITVEDPPEYIMKGINQILIGETTNLDFETALRYIFRHDPDVIYIGEIRDKSSALTAVQASLTGHLVFATLHTDGFYESLLRMQDLGIEKEKIIHITKGIIVQQLEYKKIHKKLFPFLKAKVLECNGNFERKIFEETNYLNIKKIMEALAV